MSRTPDLEDTHGGRAFALFLHANHRIVLPAGSSHAQQRNYDFVITGALWLMALVSGKDRDFGDRIVAIGDLHGAAANKKVAGLIASPRFIDVQGQSELKLLVKSGPAARLPRA